MSTKTDVLGITSASLCILHCIVTPILIAVSALWEWLEVFCYLFMALGLLSSFFATKNGNNLKIKALIWISIGLLILSGLLEEKFSYATSITYLAGISLIIGHFWNIRHCKKMQNLTVVTPLANA